MKRDRRQRMTCQSKAAQRLQNRAAARFRWHWQTVQAAGHLLQLAVPSDPDRLLADACRPKTDGETHITDPFWAQVWRSTAGLDQYLDRHPAPAVRVLELGCGTGLAGIAALLRGAEVTFTDGVSDPLLLVRITLARLPPELRSRSRVRRLRFGIDHLHGPPFPMILGSDISYLQPYWPQLLSTLQTHLARGGEVLLSDPYRSISTEFRQWVSSRGWQVDTHHHPLADASIRVLRLTRSV